MSMNTEETGTLEELGVKPGDVVECVGQWYSAPQPYDIGKHYTVDDNRKVIGRHRSGATGICAKWRIVSRASDDTPKLWRDMTDEEKGALLLAAHKGKVIETINPNYLGDTWGEVIYPSFDAPTLAYRVKPEPVRVTVDLMADFKVIGTIDLIYGEPDFGSIKMEEL